MRDVYVRILENVASNDGGVTLAWLIFGLVLLLPVLVASMLLERRSHGFASTQLRQTLFRIVVMLLYPGILGSIFFELLPSLVQISLDTTTVPLIFLEFAIIGHFCYDFIFISANYQDKAVRYRCREYIVDLIVILLLYLSATAVELGKQTADVAKIGALFSILYLLCTVWDLFRQEPRKIIAMDAGLAALYFGFTEASGFLAATLGNAVSCYLLAAFIALGTIVLSSTTETLESSPVEKKKGKHKS